LIIILMGVSGSGKSLIGQMLAQAVRWPFYDADDFHPAANIAKMKQGQPLTDQDRAPWLAALRSLIDELLADGRSAVLACSALKQQYRDTLAGDRLNIHFVYLKTDYETIDQRLRRRQDHFMSADLLASQLATLEEPADALTIDAAQPPAEIVRQIRLAFEL
jgi:gluconokinase